VFSTLKIKEITLNLIGRIQTEFSEEEIRRQPETVVSSLIINRTFTVALDGIESYSHLIVIYYMHKRNITKIKELKIHPRGRKDIEKVGLFATRTPNRPNPIGVTVVELLDRRDNVVNVRGLDAINGTPILDLKPYTYADIQENIRVPKWIKS
jgi:tRNA-Thr(GGU) m(6)t(6)A37 methyltransferase TsaA